MRVLSGVGGVLAGSALLWVSNVSADLTLTLKNDFIEKYKHRATIETSCFIDEAHDKPNPASKDGDLHIAVRCEEVNLAAVAEIMNAKETPDAVALANGQEGSLKRLLVSGAWRLWPEHGGSDEEHSQWSPPTKAFESTNPDHLFEIHPVSRFGDHDVRSTFHEINGYTLKDADDAFFHYESKRFVIEPLKKSVRMTFPGVGYNYVGFQIRLVEKPLRQSDGYTAFAEVYNPEGHLLVRKRRMVFVDGTPPAEAVKDEGPGEDSCFDVVGMPRISLALVAWRVAKSKESSSSAANSRYKDVLRWSLPYEMIIVDADKTKCGDE